MNTDILIALTGIGLLSLLAQWAAWRARLPGILFLLLFGLLAGPATGFLKPDELFGELLFPIVSLSVAVILFEGSLTLRFAELKGVGGMVRNLVTIGALVTWIVTAAAVHLLLGFEVKLALLFGALVVVTGPTVIVPILRTVRPNSAVSNVLRWEGIVIDPLGALLAVLALNLYLSAEQENVLGLILWIFAQITLTGTVMGIAAGYATAWLLRRYYVPDYLRNVFTLLLVFVVFTVSDLISHESGLLAVTLFGITLANQKDLDIDDILEFKETVSILLISALFIILAARIQPTELVEIGWAGLGVLAVLMLVARPLSVLVSAIGTGLTLREQALVAWIGPRGIVCAAVAAIIALRLEASGDPQAHLFVPLAFMIIIGTVVIQSATAKPLAALLGVRDPAPRGVLIMGSGLVARRIAKALLDLGFQAKLADSNWSAIRDARMEGIDTWYGNVVSERADNQLDLVGIGKLFAMSGRPHLDALCCAHYRSVFGGRNVFELGTSIDQEIGPSHRVARHRRGSLLFHEDMTYGRFLHLLQAGAQITTTPLSDKFDMDSYAEQYAGRFLPLFMIDTRDHLQVFTPQADLKPVAGCKIVSLIAPEEAEPQLLDQIPSYAAADDSD